jgi:hypothetical protein
MADFHSLPPDAIRGVNAPIVASKEADDDKDWPTYLCPPGLADIFFPTDFDYLRAAYTATTHRPCMTLTQRDFLLQYAREVAATETRNGLPPPFSFFSVCFP